jgi:hypothetical protein
MVRTDRLCILEGRCGETRTVAHPPIAVFLLAADRDDVRACASTWTRGARRVSGFASAALLHFTVGTLGAGDLSLTASLWADDSLTTSA